jgi:hypothetical protein
MTISSIIADVTGNERTLTVYDPTDPDAVSAVERHFEVQQVSVDVASAPEGPSDFVVLHDDGEFLAGADLEDLRRAVTFEQGLIEATDFEDTQIPDVLTHVNDTTFTSYGNERMILASREIEERAWRTTAGELHAGFQQLSLLHDQWNLYDRIGNRGVDVHVYGSPDWRPPSPDWVTVHGDDCAEIRESWFVVFDAPDGSDCALVAEERETNDFEGFWTYDDGIVTDVLGHLQSAY